MQYAEAERPEADNGRTARRGAMQYAEAERPEAGAGPRRGSARPRGSRP